MKYGKGNMDISDIENERRLQFDYIIRVYTVAQKCIPVWTLSAPNVFGFIALQEEI